jgi:hypothetical protein
MADQPQQPLQIPNLFYNPNLSAGPHFTLGRMPTRAEAAARRQDRERIRRRLAQRRLAASRYRARVATATSLTALERQFGIHITAIPPILRWLPRWFLQPGLETTVLSLLQDPPKFFECMLTFKDVQYAGEATRYLSLAIMILRMRWAFKRLANAVILRSINRRRPLPQIDPITLEPMTNPVVVYSVPTRWRYAYDPTPLIAHIRTQLSTCLYGYPDPQVPRNPNTNVEFTLAQLHSVYMQLMERGKICWQLGAYLNERASLVAYSRQYVVPIYRHDCVREALDVTNLDGTTAVSEFIYNTISAMNGVNVGHIYTTLEQAFYSRRIRSHPYLSAWRKLYIRTLVECSAISVDTLVLMHGSDTAITELGDMTSKLVRCFPAFFEEVRDILKEEQVERATRARAERQ